SGDVEESGMITDAATLLSAYQRNIVNSVTVRLESPQAFDEFKTALTTNPSLSVDVFREPEYFALQAEDLSALFFLITYMVTAIMAAGALVGAVNTMYSAVSARSLEIATCARSDSARVASSSPCSRRPCCSRSSARARARPLRGPCSA